MNVQQHARIARIKQFSWYLYVCLTWIRYVIWITWPLSVVIVLASTKGQFTVGDMQWNDVELTVMQRVLLVAFISVFSFLVLQMTHHFRALISHFTEGDIFNKTAIDHARKALFNGLVIYGLYVSIELVTWIYSATQSSPVSVHVNAYYIFALMFFGLMYVLLWALEIGCDLNEESELTI